MHPPGSEPFLRMIVAHPDDDAPRLVFADWLEEQGLGPRAAYIRLQVELHHARERGEDLTPLATRIHELEYLHPLGEVRGWADIAHIEWRQTVRGFVYGAHVENVAEFCKRADKVFAATPLGWLSVGRLGPSNLKRFLALRWLTRLHYLVLRDTREFRLDEWHALGVCPHLQGLRGFIVDRPPGPPWTTQLTEFDVVAMLRSPLLHKVPKILIQRRVAFHMQHRLEAALGERLAYVQV